MSNFEIDDYIFLKKNHPCKNNLFKVNKIGAVVEIECMNCHKKLRVGSFTLSTMIKKNLNKDETNKLENMKGFK